MGNICEILSCPTLAVSLQIEREKLQRNLEMTVKAEKIDGSYDISVSINRFPELSPTKPWVALYVKGRDDYCIYDWMEGPTVTLNKLPAGKTYTAKIHCGKYGKAILREMDINCP